MTARSALAAILGAAAITACTLGLGEYEVPGAKGAGLGENEPGADGVDGAATPAADPGDVEDGGDAGGVDGGPCTKGATADCQTPDVIDGGVCNGRRSCVQGKWGPCQVQKRCPTQWAQSEPTWCKNVDAKLPPAEHWTSSQAQANPVTLYSADLTLPFDTYGRDDLFCFVPRQTIDCDMSQTKIAVHVECTNAKLQLVHNDFEAGRRFGKEYCVHFAGPSCKVVDKHDDNWNVGATPCERWFEDVHWRVEGPPQCSPW